jgi:hypothetical protein
VDNIYSKNKRENPWHPLEVLTLLCKILLRGECSMKVVLDILQHCGMQENVTVEFLHHGEDSLR